MSRRQRPSEPAEKGRGGDAPGAGERLDNQASTWRGYPQALSRNNTTGDRTILKVPSDRDRYEARKAAINGRE